MPSKSVHYALADPSRSRILERLRTAGPGDARELGRDVGLHPNTVRSHLEVLANAELVRSCRERSGKRGRPRVVFEAARPPAEAEHELLARALAESLAELPDGVERAERAGRAWGRRMRLRGGVEQLVGALAERGFDPEVRGEQLQMRRCPFADLARAHPDVVCALHLGLLRGATEELDGMLEVTELRPFVAPQLCVATVRATRG